MSPRRRTARARVVASVVAVVLAGGLLWIVTVLISNRTVNPRGPFEGDEFRIGHVEALVDRAPFLLPDASPSRSRDVWVQHLGDDVETGWVVFSALAPGQTDRACFLRWDEDDQVFRDPCEGTAFPSDGAGLPQFPTRLDDDRRLHVDLTP